MSDILGPFETWAKIVTAAGTILGVFITADNYLDNERKEQEFAVSETTLKLLKDLDATTADGKADIPTQRNAAFLLQTLGEHGLPFVVAALGEEREVRVSKMLGQSLATITRQGESYSETFYELARQMDRTQYSRIPIATTKSVVLINSQIEAALLVLNDYAFRSASPRSPWGVRGILDDTEDRLEGLLDSIKKYRTLFGKEFSESCPDITQKSECESVVISVNSICAQVARANEICRDPEDAGEEPGDETAEETVEETVDETGQESGEET